MLNKEMLDQVIKLSQKPDLFQKGTGNIWTEPYIASQMLEAHLDQSTEAASRREEIIENTVTFLNQYIEKGSAILDLGCGPGLYAEKLCKSGHKVTGLDFSAKSIDFARRSANTKGLEIEYVCKSIFDMEYDACYDAVIQIYGELNTFSDEERDQVIKLAEKALKPGGVFIFDVTTPIWLQKEGKKAGRSWYVGHEAFWRADAHIVLEEKFEYEQNIRLEQFIVIDDGSVNVYRNWFHEYTKDTIIPVVLAGGFREVKVIENLFKEEKDEKTEWLTVIAYK